MNARRCIVASVVLALIVAAAPASGAPLRSYRNPILPRAVGVGDGLVTSCADPAVIRSREPGDRHWYAYCTTDPLNDDDRDASGELRFRLIPTFKSLDLVRWTYVGDALSQRPSWMQDLGPWAPDIAYFNKRYYLYFTAPETNLPGGGSAIGVATAPTPTGPWRARETPAVEPQDAACCPGEPRWTFDADVISYRGRRLLYYGSYFGGVSVRRLTPDGLRTLPATQSEIAIPNRYEGTHVVRHGGWFYFFGSATNCCNGPLTGYSVFAARARHPRGPFRDRDGRSILAGRVGGTPVISMNGNRWVGPGHNFVIRDFDGQDWFFYHAIDRNDPYFEGEPGFTKRPMMLDPLDWIDGWPTVRAGRWASDHRMPAPAAQPGQRTRYQPRPVEPLRRGALLPGRSDEFNRRRLDPAWTWVREPDASEWELTGRTLRMRTQDADLFGDNNSASVLTRPLPAGDWVAQVRVRLNVPPEGALGAFVQAGLVVYRDDDHYLRLVHNAIFETRQTEWAKEVGPQPEGYPVYGNTVVGPPGTWTWLRVVRQGNRYTALTRSGDDGWVRGGVWTHRLGARPRLGLVAMGGSGYTAHFDHARVFRLRP